MKGPDLDLLILADFTAQLGVGMSPNLWEYPDFHTLPMSDLVIPSALTKTKPILRNFHGTFWHSLVGEPLR